MKLFLAALLLAIAIPAQKGRPRPVPGPKPPEVQLVEIRVHREPRIVAVEGRVRNNSDRSFKGLVLFFEFLESDGKMISRKNTLVTSNPMAPGDDTEFITQTPDQARAVHIRVEAEDKDGRYLRVDKPGPYAIE
ncbi:MAG: hypothetical protein FJW20_10130 [Acidimicrobiia bacterium]|nr:hypothetical protein [Acidimicrobiia bacterium]